MQTAAVIVARMRHKCNDRRWRENLSTSGLSEIKIVETCCLSSDGIFELLDYRRADLENILFGSFQIGR